MHEHHQSCVHDSLKYCQQCDAAYCVSCKREWGFNRTWWPYTQPNQGTITIPYPQTTTFDPNNPLTYTTICSHE